MIGNSIIFSRISFSFRVVATSCDSTLCDYMIGICWDDSLKNKMKTKIKGGGGNNKRRRGVEQALAHTFRERRRGIYIIENDDMTTTYLSTLAGAP